MYQRLHHLLPIAALSFLTALPTLAQENAPERKILPQEMPISLGAGHIPDRATFRQLARIGAQRGSSSSKDVELIKFVVDIQPSEPLRIYWINTNNINMHPKFMEKVGIDFGFSGQGKDSGGRGNGRDGRDADRGRGRDQGRDEGRGKGRDSEPQSRGERGSIVMQGRGRGRQIRTLTDYSPETTSVSLRADMSYLADETAPDGSRGLYTYNLEPHVNLELGAVVFREIEKTLPIAKGKLAYRVSESAYKQDRQKYAKAGIAIYSDFEKFIALNEATAVGKLRYLADDGLPGAHDIVIASTLPNEMPRTAGVITAVRQTPLSHVNLRAVQDQIPNAYIADVLHSESINALVGKYVHYAVTAEGYTLRAASEDEVAQHFKARTPDTAPALDRDLTLTEILPLTELDFTSSKSVGAKAANVAVLKNMDFPAGTVPDGFAVPFYYYDRFMHHNGFDREIDALLADAALIADKKKLQSALKALRKRIKAGDVPEQMQRALADVHAAYPAGTSLRCRSSTNNEDLPNFSGAGLYDSYTHHVHEGHLAKSIKQVYASLWNFRAFEARELYGVDHQQVAMGVLIHPNFKGELANGVAVTSDVLYNSENSFYVNAQHGEDLVTNPEALSTPEELLIAHSRKDGYRLLKPASDNRVVLIDSELDQLRRHLADINETFSHLYNPPQDKPFAMEIEFKITAENRLVIKQARPWVF